MVYDPDRHHRRSIRLQGYDYSQAGRYFVTTVADDRACLFGGVVDDVMSLNDAGHVVRAVWEELPGRLAGVESDEFVVMPNHVHGIVRLVGAGLALPSCEPPGCSEEGRASPAPTLGDVMRVFKSLSTVWANRLLERTGSPLWQRNYYEHIIRDEDSLNRIRQYIRDNPARWLFDRENPEATNPEAKHAWLA